MSNTMSQQEYEARQPGNYQTQQQHQAEKVKKTILAPPVRYDLRNARTETVCQHLDILTHKGGPPDQELAIYISGLKHTLRMNHDGNANKTPIVFGYIPAPPNVLVMKKVIGIDGYFFKKTTVVCGIYFIWHDRETNMFLFWGPSTIKVVKALNSIRWRICKHYEEYNSTIYATIQNPQAETITTDNNYRSASPSPSQHAPAARASTRAWSSFSAQSSDLSLVPNFSQLQLDDSDTDYDDDDMPDLISYGSEPDHETPDLS